MFKVSLKENNRSEEFGCFIFCFDKEREQISENDEMYEIELSTLLLKIKKVI